jgi:Tol biopolymer transport system component
MILLAAALLALWPSAAAAAFPGKNGRIAFSAYHDFTEQCPPGYPPIISDAASDEAIFTMNPDGSGASQVTATGHRPPFCNMGFPFPPSFDFDEDPSYSPSGKRLAFTFDRYDGEDGSLPSVGVIHADGTNRHYLNDGYDFRSWRPAFSPDDKKIAFVLYSSEIGLMRSDGTHERRLTTNGIDPSFFPGGGRIVFVSDRSIFTIRLDGSHQYRLTTRSSAKLNSPDVSPDGTQIVFGRGTGIYVMRADGTHQRRLADGSRPVFSPNGKRIAFTTFTGDTGSCCAGHQGEVMVMSADGSGQHSVIPSPLPFGVSDPSELALGQPSWGPKP